MPTGTASCAFAALIFVLCVYPVDHGPRLVCWSLAQVAVLLSNASIYLHVRRRGPSLTTEDVRTWRRLGAFLTGAAWGLGGLLWPLRPDLGPGFAMAFCYAGIGAGATATLAGDPVAQAILVFTAVFPDIVQTIPDLWWMSALLSSFAFGALLITLRNSATLRESWALRFENADLLERTIAAHEAAVVARKEAERAAEAKTRFLAAASHDLRQPVQAMSLFVDVLARGAANDASEPSERRRVLEALGRTTDALRAMLEGLLDISRLDAGLSVSAPRPIAVEPLLDEVVAALRDECEAADMVVHARGRAATVFADPGLFGRVVHNLAANAVRHGGRGRVLLAVRRHAETCTVQVWDQGPGIAEADRERVFDEFVQVGNPERDRQKGLGLGLPIVRRICAMRGWPLIMRSTVGRGTMFSVTVPLAPADAPAAEAPAAVGTTSRLTVLLVEDDALVREAETSWLEGRGCKVHVAGSGDDALATLLRLTREGRAPDVLVTDHRLPGSLTGAELVRRAGGAARLPAVLLTGDVEVPLGSEPPRGLVVLRKPANGDSLWAAVQGVVAAARQA